MGHKTTLLVRGGGDLASGVIHRLYKCGYQVLVLECRKPSAIRRKVSFGEAVFDGISSVEGVTGRLIEDVSECQKVWEAGEIPILVDETGKVIKELRPDALIDAILAKRNLGTTREMAPLTVALGPGFEAGKPSPGRAPAHAALLSACIGRKCLRDAGPVFPAAAPAAAHQHRPDPS